MRKVTEGKGGPPERKRVFGRPAGRRWTAIVLSTVLVLTLAAAAGFFWHRSSCAEEEARKYREGLRRDWDAVMQKMNGIAGVFCRLDSVEEFESISDAAKTVLAELRRVNARRRMSKTPDRYRELEDAEDAALRTLSRYFVLLEELSAEGDRSRFEGDRSVLEYKANQARMCLSDFLSEADFMKYNPPDIFNAPELMAEAFITPAERARREEREEVSTAVGIFMDAVVKEFDIDTVWSMLSSNVRAALGYLNVDKEALASAYKRQTKDNPPADYYVNTTGITFTGESRAQVRVLIYPENGRPRAKELEIVREPDGWKVDVYPF